MIILLFISFSKNYEICNILQWTPPPQPQKNQDADEQISIDLGDEYEEALGTASQEEIIDLAGLCL